MDILVRHFTCFNLFPWSLVFCLLQPCLLMGFTVSLNRVISLLLIVSMSIFCSILRLGNTLTTPSSIKSTLHSNRLRPYCHPNFMKSARAVWKVV